MKSYRIDKHEINSLASFCCFGITQDETITKTLRSQELNADHKKPSDKNWYKKCFWFFTAFGLFVVYFSGVFNDNLFLDALQLIPQHRKCFMVSEIFTLWILLCYNRFTLAIQFYWSIFDSLFRFQLHQLTERDFFKLDFAALIG